MNRDIVVAQAQAALALLGFSVLGMMRRDKTQTESAVFAAHRSVEEPVEILRMKVRLFSLLNAGRKVQFHRQVHDVAESALLVP